MIPLTFPAFNVYGVLLLFLSLQGLVFCYLLLKRFYKQKHNADLYLALILLITCYHQTAYTIGFMDWYDTYPNTKINYYLINLSMVLAPLIYFYLKSVTSASFKITKKHLWHFLPWTVYAVIKLIILVYDAMQPGFDDVQNGYLVVNFEWKILNPLLFLLTVIQMLVYLSFSFQSLYLFKAKVNHFFSSTHRLEFNWLRNFLIVYSFLYLFNSVQQVINELIIDLSWTQEWWYFLLSGIAIIYVGIRGYYTDVSGLITVEFDDFSEDAVTNKDLEKEESDPVPPAILDKKKELENYIALNRPYLNPELNLISFAKELRYSREELSEVINKGFEIKFNDFINGYRVRAIQQMILEGSHDKLSLLGMAYECGFNSKATFNRAFKKEIGLSPTEYLNSLKSNQ